MSEPIKLTTEEEWAAHQAVAPLLGSVALNRQQPDYAVIPVIEAIVNAVNKARSGDPVGTIRRSLGGSGTAVRIGVRICDVDVEDDWHITWRDGRCEWRTFSIVRNWPVVFSPEVS